MSVLLGDGSGGFGAATGFGAGNLPSSVAVGDFNGDGKPDLAAANLNSANVSVLLNNCTANTTPTAICKTVTVAAGASCTATASINNGSFDPDSGDTLSFAQAPLGPYPLGASPVTLTVTDSHGAFSACTGAVIVQDQTAPALACPGNQTATATSGSGAVVNFSTTATDNCGTLTSVCAPSTGAIFPIGNAPVTCTATDGASLLSSCGFTVQVTPLAFTGISAKLEVARGRTPATGSLEYAMTFSLGAGNNGIAPLTEAVTVQVGGLTFTIPAGSFRVDNKGTFKFEGVLGGVPVEAKITPLGGARYELKLEAKPLNVAGLTNPVATQVRIGNDGGAAMVTAKFE